MMDRLVGLLVRLFAWVSKYAGLLPGIRVSRWQPGQPLKVLLTGYNGARNTGADVRVGSLIDQIKEALPGHEVEVTLMSLDAESTAVYTAGKAHQVQFTTIFFWALLRECSAHHVIVLCEGSMLKSKFANSLTLFMCMAAGIARRQGKPCVGYGGEVGEMEPFVERIARDLCRDVKIMPRTEQSLAALERLGLEGELGTDTAWPFASDEAANSARDLLMSQGWDGEAPLLGVAVINPFYWPVRPSLWKWIKAALTGNRRWQYEKWYFFSWDEERSAAYDRYIAAMTGAVGRAAQAAGAFPVIIGMEKLDLEPCRRVEATLDMPCALVSSAFYNGYIIDQVLARLQVLVTSRYHASLLAMKSGVPAVAVSMDERLDGIFAEAGLPAEMLLTVDDPQLEERILEGLQTIATRREEVGELIAAQKTRSLEMCGRMQEIFRAFVEGSYPVK